jgi:gamma-glutamyltranspeptidase/glutathione hydrolase/leukotriene-C4 hydrolase
MIDDSTVHTVDHYMMDNKVYNPTSNGTSQITVIDEEGNAVSVTCSLNNYYGSLIYSKKCGFIFNEQMDDFSIPGACNYYEFPSSPSNYLKPGNRPLSSMAPTIITKDGKVAMVIGASGGSRIPTFIIQIIIDVINLSIPLHESVPRPRLHHQLIPNCVEVEKEFSLDYIEELKKRHHTVVKMCHLGMIQVIYRNEDGTLTASSDTRKGGKPSGY